MYCKFCGKEIIDGHVYCDICGKPVQIVPDYNLLEDDLLPSFLGENKKNESVDKEKSPFCEKNYFAEENSDHGKKNSKKKSTHKKLSLKKKIVLIVGIIAAFLALLLLLASQTYLFQFKLGESSDANKQYTAAYLHYKSALKHKKTADAYLAAANDLFHLKKYDLAVKYYRASLHLNEKSSKAMYGLLLTYTKTQDYDAMNELYDIVVTSTQTQLIRKYLIVPPDFSVESGSFNDDVTLQLTSADNLAIYYTLDGTKPSDSHGNLYVEPIVIADGTTVVSAVCMNPDGKIGQCITKKYKITYQAPNVPSVSPNGGTFNTPTYLTITSDALDAKIYYTWDNSTPTVNSSLYNAPILVPEGNNVLSVIVIDKHNMCSDILRCNYRYLPN